MKNNLIPWALSGGAAVSVGFARFGYALILPAMQSDLGLSYTQAGWLNTSNSLGYLAGSILTVIVVQKTGNYRLFIAGLILAIVGILVNGLSTNLIILNLIRFITGVAAAWAFICGGVLASMAGGKAIAIYFGGGGSGMLITGVCLPWLFEIYGSTAWPLAWFGMALICTPIAIAAILAGKHCVTPTGTRSAVPWSWLPCKSAFIAYFMFGLGYIAYMTFIIAWVAAQPKNSVSLPTISSLMWSILGIMCIAAPFVWGKVFNWRSDGVPMAITMTTLGTGATLPLILPGLTGILLSAAMVGVSVLMVPSAITSFVKNNLPYAAWGSALAFATCLFAIGQTVGPVAAGWLSDLSSNLSVGLGASATVLYLGAALALTQRQLTSK